MGNCWFVSESAKNAQPALRHASAMRSACRTAASAAHPYLVTLGEGKWNGRDTYAKWSGEPLGFGRQIQAPDGAERIFRVLCPLLFLASLLLCGLAALLERSPKKQDRSKGKDVTEPRET